MSIEFLGGVAASAAGSQQAQNTGSDVERTQQDVTGRQRHVASDIQAESAAGIAATDGQDLETNDRDADGRRAWEIGPPNRPAEASRPIAPLPGANVDDNLGAALDLTV
jgi:hypothetical protein